MTDLLSASWVYRNWLACEAGEPEAYAFEVPLYSDARFVGDIDHGLGPYRLINIVPHPHEPGTVAPVAALRISVHLPDDTPQVAAAFKKGESDLTAFVGGSVEDEFSSLVSLSHQVRIAFGETNRWFMLGQSDPRGRPAYLGGQPPSMPQGRHRLVLPALPRTLPLSPDLLSSYPLIAWDSARELARAARSYRQATWVANGDGNLAWLLLVSAAETAGTEWARVRHEPDLPPGELLKAVQPDYYQRLRAAARDHADAVVTEVGSTQGSVLKAQRKFLNFLLEFGLEPPQPRPQAWPLDWSPRAMTAVLKVVYRHRSEALHASQPFPEPMCGAAFPSEDAAGTRAWSERPAGSAYQFGGLWTEEEMPINLHAFHHLVATALRRWWRELVPTSPKAPSAA